jgi:UDP-glucose 4-epimerase
MLTHLRASPARPARVVSLGANGFVAASTLRHLESADVPVLALSSSTLDLTQPSSAAALADLLRPDDALLFVSALTPDRGRDVATLMRNLQMGQHVAAALASRPVSHVVYVSTDAVYDEEANPVRESTSTQPGGGFHGTMHVTRERMLIETLKDRKTPLALLRPSLLYGAGDTHNGYGPNRFVRTAIAERAIALFGGGEEQRDHVYIDDVAALTALVLQHRSSGVLNIATGTAVSFRQLADRVRALVGADVDVRPSPRANPITHRHFDVSALLSAFPSFRFTPVGDGLERMVRAVVAA